MSLTSLPLHEEEEDEEKQSLLGTTTNGNDQPAQEARVVEWADTDYTPERENKDINSTKYETFCCCDCDRCLIGFAKFWLGCGCTQIGWSVFVWYIINLTGDVYGYATSTGSYLLAVLYTFNLLFVDVPVLWFTWRDEQHKLVFPFAVNTAMALIAALYAIDKLVMDRIDEEDAIHVGIWMLVFDGVLYFFTALSLIPIFTYRLKLWNSSNVEYSYLYPHSSAYLRRSTAD